MGSVAAAERAFEYWMTRYGRTWRGSVMSSALTPVLFLGAMGIGLGGYVSSGTGRVDGVRYAVYLAPGLLAATAMQTAIGESTWPVLGAIKWQKAYLAMIAAPLSVTDVLLGHLAFMAVRICIVSALFTVVMAAFGLIHSVGGAVLGMLCAVLTGLAFAAPVTAFAATQQRETGFALLYRFALIPLFLFSGTFFPVAQLPGFLRPIAYLTPLWHGVTLCRDLALSRGSVAGMCLHAAYLVVVTVVGVAVGVRTFRRRLLW